jgi:hypothetical protein
MSPRLNTGNILLAQGRGGENSEGTYQERNGRTVEREQPCCEPSFLSQRPRNLAGSIRLFRRALEPISVGHEADDIDAKSCEFCEIPS